MAWEELGPGILQEFLEASTAGQKREYFKDSFWVFQRSQRPDKELIAEAQRRREIKRKRMIKRKVRERRIDAELRTKRRTLGVETMLRISIGRCLVCGRIVERWSSLSNPMHPEPMRAECAAIWMHESLREPEAHG